MRVVDLVHVCMYPRQLVFGAALHNVGKMIRLTPVPVSDRADDEILSLNKSLLVGLTIKVPDNIVFPITINVPPTDVFPLAFNVLFQLAMLSLFCCVLYPKVSTENVFIPLID